MAVSQVKMYAVYQGYYSFFFTIIIVLLILYELIYYLF